MVRRRVIKIAKTLDVECLSIQIKVTFTSLTIAINFTLAWKY